MDSITITYSLEEKKKKNSLGTFLNRHVKQDCFMPANGNRLFKFYSHWTENFLNGLIAETVPFLYTFELSYK